MIESTENAVPKAYARYRSEIQAYRKGRLIKWVGTQDALVNNLQEQLKKPAELEAAKPDINEKYKATQDTEKNNPPLAAFLSSLNPNPKTESKKSLANKFHQIKMINWVSELSSDPRFSEKKAEFEMIARNSGTINFADEIESVKKVVRKALENTPTLLRFVNYEGEVVYDPKHLGVGFRPGPNAKSLVRLDGSYRFEYPETLTTLEYAKQLEIDYDVDFRLQPFLKKGGDLILMPLSSAINHKNWLESHGHNIQDAKVILFPFDAVNRIDNILQNIQSQFDSRSYSALSDYDRIFIINFWARSDGQLYTEQEVQNAGRNLYLPHYVFFRNELKDWLYSKGVITGNTLGALAKVTGDQVKRLTEYMNKDPTADRYKMTPDYSDLGMLYGGIKAKVVQNHWPNQEEIMEKVDMLFDLQYKIYGLEEFNGEPINRFYKIASRTFYSWEAIMRSFKVPDFSRVSLAALSRVIGSDDDIFSVNLWKLLNGEVGMQESETVESYLKDLGNRANLPDDIMRGLLRGQLRFAAESYIKAIKDVENYEPIMIVKFEELKNRFPNSPRLHLIEQILNILGNPDLTVIEFSEFLFGESNGELYLTNEFLGVWGDLPKIMKRPDLRTLNWMKNKILDSDLLKTGSWIQGLDINVVLKEHILSKIDAWIYDNPFRFEYVADSPLPFKVRYGDNIDKMTFEVLNYIQHAFAVFTDNPKVSFDEIMRITRARSSLSLGLVRDSSGRTAPATSLEKAKLKLLEALNSETDTNKKSVYSNTILAIDYYIDYLDQKHSESYLNSLRRPTHKSLRGIFNSDEYIRKYLITNIIARDLGFDSLFFDFIEESHFATGTYALHHKSKLRSWSIYIRDLLITRQGYHAVYDSMAVSDRDTQIVSQGLEMLIEIGLDNYKKGNDPPITRNDISNVFLQLGGGRNQYVLADGRTVLEWWEKGSTYRKSVQSVHSFSDRLDAFNDRIKFLADNNKNYKVWIDHYYNQHASDWLNKFEITLNMYESMSKNLNSKRLLHLYLHLEDIGLIREKWKVW